MIDRADSYVCPVFAHRQGRMDRVKIYEFMLAAGCCALLTGCAGEMPDRTAESDISSETVTDAAETSQTETKAESSTTDTVTTTSTESTAVTTTTTEPAKPYQWVKEPFLEADDVNVVPAENTYGNYGDFLETDFALIMQDDLLGMADYDGNVVMEPKYKAVSGKLNSENAHYEFINDPSPMGGSQIFCVKSKQFFINESYECPHCTSKFSTCYIGTGFVYESEQGFSGTYAGDILRSAAAGDELWLHGQIGFERRDDLTETVAARSIILPAEYLTDTSVKGTVSGGFGLIRNNTVILPFDYENALDFKSGVTALCKDGKWGYVNAEGTVIVPFAYDADFIYSYDPNRYIPNFGEEGKDQYVPYLPSEGYIALNAGDQAGYCDSKGQEVVPVGEFMNARPVHNGKAWVQDADTKLWGIISIG